MTAITSLWPFSPWGIDIVGPLPQGKRQVKFLLVDIDYFTKWVEAKALPAIMEEKIQNFVWRNIVCRFGIPITIISNNGCQFDNQDFKNFCSKLRIKNQFSSPGHPQANRQTEVMNRTLLKILKVRLESACPKVVPNVLWDIELPRGPQQERHLLGLPMAPRQ